MTKHLLCKLNLGGLLNTHEIEPFQGTKISHPKRDGSFRYGNFLILFTINVLVLGSGVTSGYPTPKTPNKS
jgi:hypothetical protein